MRSNVPVGRAAWARVVAGYEKSGLTHADFCDARGLNLATFRSWLYRLRNEQARHKEAPPKLVELVAAPDRREASGCVVQTGACEVRFSTRPEAEYLAALLRAIEDR